MYYIKKEKKEKVENLIKMLWRLKNTVTGD